MTRPDPSLTYWTALAQRVWPLVRDAALAGQEVG